MSPLTTHILDTRLGRPAGGVAVQLEKLVADDWQLVASGVTNDDGRIGQLLAPDGLSAGRHRMTFETRAYFDKQQIDYFYPRVTVEFEITGADQHYHVPLLLSPFGYSTYRGS